VVEKKGERNERVENVISEKCGGVAIRVGSETEGEKSKRWGKNIFDSPK